MTKPKTDLLADLADAEAEQERLTVALRLAQARAADAETETRLLKDEVKVWRDLALREERAGQQRIIDLAAERYNLRKQVAAMTDPDRLSIMDDWLVWDAGEHTCGGYGPESGYAHEPGCGYEPILDLSKMEGWPGAERDALAAKVERVADEVARIADESQHEDWDSPCVRSIVGRIQRALDGEADR